MAPLMLLLAAAAPDTAREQALMDEIEAAVTMPPHASSLNAYARYYIAGADGMVRAVYLVPSPLLDDRRTCRKRTPAGVIRPCTEVEVANLAEKRVLARRLRAGERRWEADARQVPNIADGGCRQITVDYDPALKRFVRVRCNG